MSPVFSIVDFWIAQLHHYSLQQLLQKPSPSSWSLGQLYMHLISDTNFYIENIRQCLAGNGTTDGEPVAFAQQLFLQNAFPDVTIEGDPNNAHMPQPKSKDALLTDMQNIRGTLLQLQQKVEELNPVVKTKHPGLGYFTAQQWLQFADIHFTHHLRQKKRIDTFLQSL